MKKKHGLWIPHNKGCHPSTRNDDPKKHDDEKMNPLVFEDYGRRKRKYEWQYKRHWLRTTGINSRGHLMLKFLFKNLFLLESLNHTSKNGLILKIGMWEM